MCKITHKNTQLRLNLFIPCGLVDPDSKTSIAWPRAPLLWRFLAEERATFVLKTWKRQLWKHQQIMKDLEEGQKSNKKFSIPLCSSAEWKRGVWFGPTKCGQNAGASINKESQSWEGIDLDLLQCVFSASCSNHGRLHTPRQLLIPPHGVEGREGQAPKW